MTVIYYRQARILHGDTLQTLALRELGDAGRWAELIYANDLQYPYIVPTAAQKTTGVLTYGDYLRVPSTLRHRSATLDHSDLFGVDVALTERDFTVTNGDLSVVDGLPNLRQAIRHRVDTDLQEILRHPDYGCGVRTILGAGNTPANRLLAAGFVKRALRNEPRVDTVSRVKVSSSGDAVVVDATVIPVHDNTPYDLNLVLTE